MKELDYRVPTVDECIAAALEWYRGNGFFDKLET